MASLIESPRRPTRIATYAALFLAAAVTVAAPAVARAQEVVPLVSFFNPTSGGYFTTSQPSWTCLYFLNCSDGSTIPPAGYRAERMQGYVFNPVLTQPAGTRPLWHWFNARSGDNHLTSEPGFDPALGTTRNVSTGSYQFVRLTGYVFDTPQGVGLDLFTYNNLVELATLTTARDVDTGRFDGLPTTYSRGRFEGALLRPYSAPFQRCRGGGVAPSVVNPSVVIPVPLAYWSAPQQILHGDAFRVTAPAESYRIDYWGTSKSTRGEDGTFTTGAVRGGEGLRRYAMVAAVQGGRVFVEGQGWFESGRAFVALGTTGTAPGPCVYVDLTGVPPNPEVLFAFNDPRWWDNGGSATVAVRQWY